MKHFLFLCLAINSVLFGDQVFLDKTGENLRISVVNSPGEVVPEKAKQILVRSFMTAYEDVALADLDPSFKSIGDVRRFYENYFDSEFAHFQTGALIWIQAFLGEKLIGWATFELEENNQAYMNLLAVDPDYQKRGVGKHLVFSICSEELFSNIEAINVLIRNVNVSGRHFYERIGFCDAPDYAAKENFVDNSLLSPIRWVKEGEPNS